MHLNRCVLKLDGQPISVGDVFALELLTGALSKFRTLLEENCQKAALLEEAGKSLAQEELEALFDDWRSELNLLSAEDTEKWFDKLGINMGEVLAHLERKALAQRFDVNEASATPSTAINPSISTPFPELEKLLPTAAFLEGIFDPLVHDFALHAVAPRISTPAQLDQTILEILGHLKLNDEAEFSHRASTYLTSSSRAREILEYAANFHFWSKNHMTQAVLERELASKAQEYRWFDIETVFFGTSDAAQEAIWCVKEEKLSLAEVADRAEVVCTRARWFYTDLMGIPAGPRIISARELELVGPQELNGSFTVYQVRARVQAELHDPLVYAKVRERVLKQLLARELSQRIQWPAL